MDIFKNCDCKAKILNFKESDIIFKQGDNCEYLAYIESGKVVAKVKYEDGKDVVLRIISDGEYIGINLLFSKEAIYRANFICLEDATIKLISKDELVDILSNDKNILVNYLEILSNMAVSQNDHLKMINIKTIKSKICYFLYEEYKKNKSMEFEIKYTKTELSQILNIQRPSLGFEIKNLVDEKIIENQNRWYKILSMEKLLQYIYNN